MAFHDAGTFSNSTTSNGWASKHRLAGPIALYAAQVILQGLELERMAMRRANGSIRFEFNDAVDEGLSFGIPILEV